MFFQGQLASTISITEIAADIVGILTGTITSGAGLSASFLGGSTFINTDAPGWTLHDAAAGAPANGVTPVVLRAPLKGSGVLHKHLYIGTTSVTQLVFNGYETWDEVSHTGTFPMVAVPALNSWQTLSLVANKLVTISATANHVYVATADSPTVPSNVVMIAEYSRDDPWNTLANGYHAWVQTGVASASVSGSNSAITRAYNAAGSADVSPVLFGVSTVPWAIITTDYASTNSTAGAVQSSQGGGGIGAQADNLHPSAIAAADASKNPTRTLYSVGVRQASSSSNAAFLGTWLGGSISTGTDGYFYFLAKDAAIGGDVITMGAAEYTVSRIPSFTKALLAIKRA